MSDPKPQVEQSAVPARPPMQRLLRQVSPVDVVALTPEVIREERAAEEHEDMMWRNFSIIERRAWSKVIAEFAVLSGSVMREWMIDEQIRRRGISSISAWIKVAYRFSEKGYTPNQYYQLLVSLHALPENLLTAFAAQNERLLTVTPPATPYAPPHIDVNAHGWAEWIEAVRAGYLPTAAMKAFVLSRTELVRVGEAPEPAPADLQNEAQEEGE